MTTRRRTEGGAASRAAVVDLITHHLDQARQEGRPGKRVVELNFGDGGVLLTVHDRVERRIDLFGERE